MAAAATGLAILVFHGIEKSVQSQYFKRLKKGPNTRIHFWHIGNVRVVEI